MKTQVNELAEKLIPQETKKDRFHAVMLFIRPCDLGVPSDLPGSKEWNNTKTVRFNNALDALNFYANTKCPASQHISASTKEELEEKIQQMNQNFKNEDWLNENLYPFL